MARVPFIFRIVNGGSRKRNGGQLKLQIFRFQPVASKHGVIGSLCGQAEGAFWENVRSRHGILDYLG